MKTLKLFCSLLCILFYAVSISTAASPVALDPIALAAKSGETVVLPKGEYQTAGTLIFRKAAVTIDGSGSLLTGPLTGTWIISAAPHITFKNFVIPNGPIIAGPQADYFTLQGCKIGLTGKVGQAMKTGNGGTHATLKDCEIGVTRTVSFFADRDYPKAVNCKFAGSDGEYAIRGSSVDGKTIPKGFIIENCYIVNHNGPGKDAIGLREFTDCRITNTTVDGWIRIGQTNKPPTTVPGSLASVIVDNCTFKNAGPRSCINVDQGATATITGNTFDHSAAPPIAADSQSITTEGNNLQTCLTTTRPWPFFVSSHGGKHIYTGGDRTEVNHATTQPVK